MYVYRLDQGVSGQGSVVHWLPVIAPPRSALSPPPPPTSQYQHLSPFHSHSPFHSPCCYHLHDLHLYLCLDLDLRPTLDPGPVSFAKHHKRAADESTPRWGRVGDSGRVGQWSWCHRKGQGQEQGINGLGIIRYCSLWFGVVGWKGQLLFVVARSCS